MYVDYMFPGLTPRPDYTPLLSAIIMLCDSCCDICCDVYQQLCCIVEDAEREYTQSQQHQSGPTYQYIDRQPYNNNMPDEIIYIPPVELHNIEQHDNIQQSHNVEHVNVLNCHDIITQSTESMPLRNDVEHDDILGDFEIIN